MIKTKSDEREVAQMVIKRMGLDTIPQWWERRIQLDELCVEKGIDTDILQKLSGIASLYGYSEEFCNFLANMAVTSLPVDVDDSYTHVDVFIELLMSKAPEEIVIKNILGYAREHADIDGPCGVSKEYMAKYEKEQEEKFNNPRAFYAKYGEEEYNRYCDKDGTFSYAAFLKQNHR
ncbi:MAG: hypothetical protein IJT83_09670 [Victivallales bacterium]|nr:hypothetical protein [Victivallales bacterium]